MFVKLVSRWDLDKNTVELASLTIKLPFLCQKTCQEFVPQTQAAENLVSNRFAILMIGLELLLLVMMELVRYWFYTRREYFDTEALQRDNLVQVNQHIHFHNHARQEDEEEELERQ